MSDVRQRKKAAPAAEPKSPAALAKEEDSAFSLIDIARGVVFLLLASTALSYFITKESFVWNVQRPAFTKLDFVKSWMNGPQQYTDADLAKYDGSDPSLPILLAINGTIYDVSAGRRHYGPGGSYHAFAGADASRGFVSSCFDLDRVPDMRGLEEMFIPFDDAEADGAYTPEALADLKKREQVYAKEQVESALKHWVDFFEGSGKYPKVGRVKREPGWENKGPVRKLCKLATESRPKKRLPPPKA